jgi:histidinol-phosphate aminotransferase
MPLLWKAKQPNNVSVAASRAAIASLGDLDTLEEKVAILAAERERMFAALSRFPGIQPYPSRANFVLCRIDRSGKDGNASPGQALKASLAERGILIRYFDKPGLQDCIRISAGKPEQTDRLLEVLHELL